VNLLRKEITISSLKDHSYELNIQNQEKPIFLREPFTSYATISGNFSRLTIGRSFGGDLFSKERRSYFYNMITQNNTSKQVKVFNTTEDDNILLYEFDSRVLNIESFWTQGNYLYIIGDNVIIGDNTTIYPNVTIYRDCHVGSDCIIHSGTVIGSDGFGFATDKTTGIHIKIYQNGNVVIGNNVEIGANCTIDRAVFQSTIIEDMVRIDNLVHIAHNCKIAKGSILAGQVGISGSTILNEYVVMGGQSATVGHIEIAPFTTISARGGVTKTISEPKKQWAGFPLMEHRTWLRLQGKIQKLLKG